MPTPGIICDSIEYMSPCPFFLLPQRTNDLASKPDHSYWSIKRFMIDVCWPVSWQGKMVMLDFKTMNKCNLCLIPTHNKSDFDFFFLMLYSWFYHIPWKKLWTHCQYIQPLPAKQNRLFACYWLFSQVWVFNTQFLLFYSLHFRRSAVFVIKRQGVKAIIKAWLKSLN